VPDETDDSALFDLAPSEPAPVTKRAVAPAVAGGPVPLAYRSPSTATRAPASPEQIRDLQLPLWLLGGGVAAELLAGFVFHGRAGASPLEVVLKLIVGTPLLLLAVWIAARFRGIDFGPVQTAALKLAALVVAPSGLIDLCGGLLMFVPFGFVIAWLVQLVLFFTLLGALFDLDESDTWYCLGVIFLVWLGFVAVLATLFG
jgi:hypothetical protein